MQSGKAKGSQQQKSTIKAQKREKTHSIPKNYVEEMN